MSDNLNLLRALVEEARVDMRWDAAMERSPGPGGAVPFERFEGMMLGLAIGDALGNPTESINPGDRRRLYGDIEDYPAGKKGLPSDDTQMSFWTLQSLMENDGLDPSKLSDAFRHKSIYGIGKSVKEFLRNADKGLSWERRGVPSAGNGALMRIAPVIFPHLVRPGPGLWADAALAAMVTHNDSMAVSSAVALTSILWECLHASAQPDPIWWLDHFVEVLRRIETEKRYRPRMPGETGEWKLSDFLDRRVRRAYSDGLSLLEAQQEWHSGAYLLETVPCVVLTVMRHAGNPEEAIIRSVNDTRDNDTVAAIVGAVAGALHGKSMLPARWIDGLAGRTGEADDGRVFELLRQASEIYSSHHAT
jgi:ADP-ribosylglycohydrolase